MARFKANDAVSSLKESEALIYRVLGHTDLGNVFCKREKVHTCEEKNLEKVGTFKKRKFWFGYKFIPNPESETPFKEGDDLRVHDYVFVVESLQKELDYKPGKVCLLLENGLYQVTYIDQDKIVQRVHPREDLLKIGTLTYRSKLGRMINKWKPYPLCYFEVVPMESVERLGTL